MNISKTDETTRCEGLLEMDLGKIEDLAASWRWLSAGWLLDAWQRLPLDLSIKHLTHGRTSKEPTRSSTAITTRTRQRQPTQVNMYLNKT